MKIRRVSQWLEGAWAELRVSYATTSFRGWVLNHLELILKLAWFGIRRVCGAKPYAGWRARLRACSRCPVFHRRLMTCGRAGQMWFNPETQEVEQRGCLCPLRLKAQLPEAQCWSSEDHWKNL
jgi:hypothetical protein